jgi:predicted anti-sigma-YlaC factor YlaD
VTDSDLERIAALAKATLATRPDEIDCEEWLARVAAYLEHRGSADPLPPELQLVANHVEICPACRAELDVLAAALDAERT